MTDEVPQIDAQCECHPTDSPAWVTFPAGA